MSSQHYPLYLAGVMTGMRRSELLGLRWADFNSVLATLTVRQSFIRLGKEQVWKEPKSQSSRRTLDLPKVLVESLLQLREKQREHKTLFGERYEDHDLIFCQPCGKPLHAGNIERRDFREVLKRAKLPRVTFHSLRHLHGTLLLKNGANIKLIQERLGHSSPSLTLSVYSHVLPGMQAEAVQQLETRLFGERNGKSS